MILLNCLYPYKLKGIGLAVAVFATATLRKSVTKSGSPVILSKIRSSLELEFHEPWYRVARHFGPIYRVQRTDWL